MEIVPISYINDFGYTYDLSKRGDLIKQKKNEFGYKLLPMVFLAGANDYSALTID